MMDPRLPAGPLPYVPAHPKIIERQVSDFERTIEREVLAGWGDFTGIDRLVDEWRRWASRIVDTFALDDDGRRDLSLRLTDIIIRRQAWMLERETAKQSEAVDAHA